MKLCTLLLLFSLAGLTAAPRLRAQELDGSDLNKELRERDDRINKLTTEEQLQLRAAQKKAAEDPAVVEALQRRNEAIRAFRQAIREAMIKADPKVAPLIEKVAIPEAPGR